MATLSEALKEAYASCPAAVVVYHTLEIRQTGVQAPIYLVQGFEELTAVDEESESQTFQPIGFQFTLPPADEEGFQSLTIAIDNVGRTVLDFLETAKASKVPVEILYRPYLSTDLTQSQMDPPLRLYLKDVRVTATQVTGRATFMDIVNRKFPSWLYNRERFPSLG